MNPQKIKSTPKTRWYLKKKTERKKKKHQEKTLMEWKRAKTERMIKKDDTQTSTLPHSHD